MKVIDIRSKIDLTGKIKDSTLYGYMGQDGGFHWCSKMKLDRGDGTYEYPLYEGNIIHIKPHEVPDCIHRSVRKDEDNVFRCNKCERDLKPNWTPK